MGEDTFYGNQNPFCKGEKENAVEHEIDITVGAIELALVQRMHDTKKSIFEPFYREAEDCKVLLKFKNDDIRAVLEHASEESEKEGTFSNGRTIGSFHVGNIVEDEIVFADDFVLEGVFSEDVPKNFEKICFTPLTQEQQEFLQYAYSEYQLENKSE